MMYFAGEILDLIKDIGKSLDILQKRHDYYDEMIKELIKNNNKVANYFNRKLDEEQLRKGSDEMKIKLNTKHYDKKLGCGYETEEQVNNRYEILKGILKYSYCKSLQCKIKELNSHHFKVMGGNYYEPK